MRLIGCYIENYGTLSGCSLNFNEGLTVINEENGFGKSTLASFIMAMLYGLPQTAKRSVKENERKLRAPWQGGNFGGTLDFEVGGKEYRVERFFGAKANDDTFKLFDLASGKESDDYDENLGVLLFGIDAEGFKRSIFLPQLDVATESNVSIMTKLTDLVENSDDLNNYDKAVAIIEKRKSELYKLNGKKGSIAELKSKITTTEAELVDSREAYENVKELTVRIESYKKQVEVLEAEREQTRRELSIASDAAAARANKARREEVLRELKEVSSELEAINQRYPSGLPSFDELESASETAENYKRTQNEYRILTVDGNDEQKELARLRTLFDGAKLTDEDLNQKRAEVSRLSSLKVSADAKRAFLKEVDSETQGPKRGLGVVLFVVAGVLLVAGIIAIMFKPMVGIILLFAALVFGGAAAFSHLKNMISSAAPKNNADIEREYNALLKEITETENNLTEFFDRYNLSGDFSENIFTLVSLKKDYDRLTQSVKEQTEKINACVEKGKLTKKALEDFMRKYSVLGDDYAGEILKMRDAARSFTALADDLSELQKKLEQLPEVGEVKHISEEEYEALKSKEKTLGPKIDILKKEIGDLENKISGLIPAADSVAELENEVERLKAQKEEQEEQLFVIEKTLELLEKARDSLTSRYRDPLTVGFKKYADLMLGDDVGEFMMDNELSVQLNRYGRAVEKEFFSAGYQNLIDIATRFALIDALYTDEKPAVILDDPFVNLDETKLQNALVLLEKLATERQIIYLTCHKSRVPQ